MPLPEVMVKRCKDQLRVYQCSLERSRTFNICICEWFESQLRSLRKFQDRKHTARTCPKKHTTQHERKFSHELWNCWWTKSCTTKDDDYPIIFRVLTIPGGAGFLPSTELLWYYLERIDGDRHPRELVHHGPFTYGTPPMCRVVATAHLLSPMCSWWSGVCFR